MSDDIKKILEEIKQKIDSIEKRIDQIEKPNSHPNKFDTPTWNPNTLQPKETRYWVTTKVEDQGQCPKCGIVFIDAHGRRVTMGYVCHMEQCPCYPQITC